VVSPAPGVAREVEALLLEGGARPVSAADLSANLGLPPGRLARSFRSETGESLARRLLRARVRTALVLLTAGGRTLAEAAILAGFRSDAELCRSYRKLAGRVHVLPRRRSRVA
jgi:transcriptional regulator GlxA family with amidase domain